MYKGENNDGEYEDLHHEDKVAPVCGGEEGGE